MESGKDFNRSGYQALKNAMLRSGDTLIVKSLDRLSRNKSDIRTELQYFKDNNIRLKVVDLPTTMMDLPKGQEWVFEMVNNILIEVLGTIAEQERQINVYRRNESSYLGQLASKDDTIENLREKNNLMSYEIAFYDRHVVFVADDGTKKYHNYSCEYLDLSYFWAYNTEAAEDRGYKPCSHCCD